MEKTIAEKMKELLQDEKFLKKISKIKSAEELQKTFEDEGVKMTLEEAKLSLEKANEIKKKYQSGELSESELESISGGSLRQAFKDVGKALTSDEFIAATIIGTGAAAVILAGATGTGLVIGNCLSD